MSEDLQKQRGHLEAENNKLRALTGQWESILAAYKGANEKLQLREQALSATLERIRQSLIAGSLSWWEWDYSSGSITSDDDYIRLLGFDPSDKPLTFEAFVNMIHPEDQLTLRERIRSHVEGKTAEYNMEFRLRTSQGTWKWFADRGRITTRDILGKPVRIAGILVDIDEGKRTERELTEARDQSIADSRAKSSFLASMSHEIYTPLAGVVGMAQILRQSKLTQEHNEYLDALVKSATDLMSILNDILEFSKIEAGRIEFHEKPFSIHQVVEEIVLNVCDKATEKGIQVIFFEDPFIPAEVVGDPVRVRQVLKILTDNALKFTEKGEIRIEAFFSEWDDDTVKVKFNVADTGIGITSESIKKIFQSFTKANAPEAKKYGGGGLGLAIARYLVQRMYGNITVESTPGEGTVFSVLLTFDRYQESETEDPMKGILRGKKVLILDPEVNRAAFLRNYFDRWDCEAEVYHDPQEAMVRILHQTAVKQPYTLLIVEYQLPGITGLEFAARITRDPKLKSSKILLTSCRNIQVMESEMAAAGVLENLARPHTLSKLKNRLKETISQIRSDVEEQEGEDEHLLEIRKRILRVLLAEDNLINQKVAKVVLEKMGHHVDIADNGRIAVQMFREGKYDLILMDIHMPEMDGREATRKIRELEAADPERFPVQICALTANFTDEDEELCYQAGMNSYISKPFKLEELTKVLNRI